MNSELVTIPPTSRSQGLTVPYAPWALLLSLEERGVRVELTERQTIRISPIELLTEEEKNTVRRYREHLICLLQYEPAPVQ